LSLVQHDTNRRTHSLYLRATISIMEAGTRPLFPADSKRLQYTKTQLNSKDGIVRKIYCRIAFVTTDYSSSSLSLGLLLTTSSLSLQDVT